jgi:phosphoglycerate dehydrogenase-like enzyme
MGMDIHAFTLHERATPESRHDDSFTEPGLGDPTGEMPSCWFHGKEQLDEFLSGVDLLVIILPLTKLTAGLISRREMEILGKRKAFLTNVGRGAIVNTDDLVESLNDGTLCGAALDVTEPEPLPEDHPLWKAKNVIITPHVSGNSINYNRRILKILMENIKRRANGQELINKVNKTLGY